MASVAMNCMLSFEYESSRGGQSAGVRMGHWRRGGYAAVTKVSLGAAGATGGLIVEVLLANYYEPRNSCQTSFRTDYPSLAEFQRQLQLMMRNERAEAILGGTAPDR